MPAVSLSVILLIPCFLNRQIHHMTSLNPRGLPTSSQPTWTLLASLPSAYPLPHSHRHLSECASPLLTSEMLPVPLLSPHLPRLASRISVSQEAFLGPSQIPLNVSLLFSMHSCLPLSWYHIPVTCLGV